MMSTLSKFATPLSIFLQCYRAHKIPSLQAHCNGERRKQRWRVFLSLTLHIAGCLSVTFDVFSSILVLVTTARARNLLRQDSEHSPCRPCLLFSGFLLLAQFEQSQQVTSYFSPVTMLRIPEQDYAKGGGVECLANCPRPQFKYTSTTAQQLQLMNQHFQCTKINNHPSKNLHNKTSSS